MTEFTFSALLLDIEGTTTSLSFVKDTLFPYVSNNIFTFLKSHWNDNELQPHITALKELVWFKNTNKYNSIFLSVYLLSNHSTKKKN